MNDRTAQVWQYDRSIYLIVAAPFKAPRVREVMGLDVWYHPCVVIDEGIHTVLGETEGKPWEDIESTELFLEEMLITRVKRKRIA